jgi:acyl-CoA synthetase (AMP-forming)/AMP-acid ligase II
LIRSFRADFTELVNASPENAMIVDARNESTYTYEQTHRLVGRCRSLFDQNGLRPGDCVLSLLPNSADGIVLFLGAALSALALAPVPPEATPTEVLRTVQLVHPRLCFVSDMISDAVSHALEDAGVPLVRVPLDGSLSWLPATEAAESAPDVAGRLYLTTSGSTGEPKAMAIDIDRLWSSGKAFAARHRALDSESRFFNILPISYLGGLFNLCLIPIASGGSFVVTEPFSGRSLLNFWQQIDQFDVNVLWLVPSIVRGLLSIAERTARHRVKRTNRVRLCLLGTAPIDLATKKRFQELFGIPVLENFALSETTFLTSEFLDDGLQRVEGSVGGVLPYVTLRFCAESDSAHSLDEAPTELGVRTPFLFLGYLQSDGSLSLPLDEDGYFRTGDLGHLTVDGQLVLDGRLRDVIKKGGYFVGLREIEVLAEGHDAVAEAAAVAVPHEFYGESYRLLVILKDGYSSEMLPALGAWLRERLVRYKWPDKIEAVDAFPRTASGKIRKNVLALQAH